MTLHGAFRPRVVLTALVLLGAAFLVDQPVARMAGSAGADIIGISRFVSWFGQGGVILYPTGVILLALLVMGAIRPSLRPRLLPLIAATGLIFATVAAAGLVDNVLKITFGRARPFLWLAGDTSGFDFFRYGAKFASFPSGHTATSFAAATVFGVLWPRGRVVFVALAALIALSRITGGAHYPSDVIAGACVGGATAVIVLGLSPMRRLRQYLPKSAGGRNGAV